MVRRARRLFLFAMGLAALELGLGTVSAQKGGIPRSVNELVIGEDDVKHLLRLMNADAKGTISKREFMRFMEAEFDHLDRNRVGELDLKRLTQSEQRVRSFASVGK